MAIQVLVPLPKSPTPFGVGLFGLGALVLNNGNVTRTSIAAGLTDGGIVQLPDTVFGA
jgi:hypothetical protein